MNTTITSVIAQYLETAGQEGYHRYHSWDHLQETLSSNESKKHQALHLGFYLASWGMYRGSGGLLQKNHKIHEGAIEIYHSEEYDDLKCSSTLDLAEGSIEKIIKLRNAIAQHYQGILFKRGNDPLKPISTTDTLMSKIMLGLFGCVPAYDDFLIKGLKEQGIKKRKLDEPGLEEIFRFYQANLEEIDSCIKQIQIGRNVYYPPMKVIDMYFWQIGYNSDLKGQEIKKIEKVRDV